MIKKLKFITFIFLYFSLCKHSIPHSCNFRICKGKCILLQHKNIHNTFWNNLFFYSCNLFCMLIQEIIIHLQLIICLKKRLDLFRERFFLHFVSFLQNQDCFYIDNKNRMDCTLFLLKSIHSTSGDTLIEDTCN